MQVKSDESDIAVGAAVSITPNHKPLKITVAPNGARRRAEQNPALPISVAEIAVCARDCYAAGADEIHLHVRDEQGQHSLSVDLYEQAIAAIRAIVPDMAIQVTTESAGVFSALEQYEVLRELRPASASVSVREVLRDTHLAPHFYAMCARIGIDVQHILYSLEDLELLKGLLAAEIVPQSMTRVILVFGKYASELAADPSDVAPFVAALGDGFPDWTVCAFGDTELEVAQAAIALGGHVRVGFENNLNRPNGEPLQDNVESVSAVVKLAHALNRPLLKDQ